MVLLLYCQDKLPYQNATVCATSFEVRRGNHTKKNFYVYLVYYWCFGCWLHIFCEGQLSCTTIYSLLNGALHSAHIQIGYFRFLHSDKEEPHFCFKNHTCLGRGTYSQSAFLFNLSSMNNIEYIIRHVLQNIEPKLN